MIESIAYLVLVIAFAVAVSAIFLRLFGGPASGWRDGRRE